MTFKKLAVAAIFSLLANICVAAAGATVQPIKLVDQPTAGAFLKGQYGLAFNFFDNGGLAYSFGLGITDRFSIGIAHQLSGAIGSGKIKVQNVPGVLLKYRIIEENYYFPGFALGFESQGSGEFYNRNDDSNYPRFQFKSKGFYCAASKSYLFLGQPLGFHALVNYSTIDNQAASEGSTPDGKPANRIVNFSLGIDKSINEELSLLAEYDLAIDDNHERALEEGYLNVAVRWMMFPAFTIELALKDILTNKKLPTAPEGVLREIRIYYTNKF